MSSLTMVLKIVDGQLTHAQRLEGDGVERLKTFNLYTEEDCTDTELAFLKGVATLLVTETETK